MSLIALAFQPSAFRRSASRFSGSSDNHRISAMPGEANDQ
jgi:hypothetical protein